MPVPRRRRSKSKKGMNRTHKKLHAARSSQCANCQALKRPHEVCPVCHQYKGRSYSTTVTTA